MSLVIITFGSLLFCKLFCLVFFVSVRSSTWLCSLDMPGFQTIGVERVFSVNYFAILLFSCYSAGDSAVFLMRRNRCPNSASRLTFHLCNNAGGGAPTSRAALPPFCCLPPTFLPPAFSRFYWKLEAIGKLQEKIAERRPQSPPPTTIFNWTNFSPPTRAAFATATHTGRNVSVNI